MFIKVVQINVSNTHYYIIICIQRDEFHDIYVRNLKQTKIIKIVQAKNCFYDKTV